MDIHPNWYLPVSEIVRRLCVELDVPERHLKQRLMEIRKDYGSLDNWRAAKRVGLAA